MKLLRLGLAFVIVLAVALQLVPRGEPRTNPPSPALIDGPPEVMEILRTSCFDCHSNETEWPWYSYVAPMSWLVTEDVAGGRSRMNLSEWGDLRLGYQKRYARKMVERVEKGEMPMWQYTAVHWDARVSEEELEVLRAWRDEITATEAAPPGE